ncbi:hypothetical protein AUJ67_05305 [Candidatus Desantisbacteria bacterium CG1_02_49_89]|nr:MAG: hypothetical protein AUJ67_05305 [Candidatus Desantisbacteria bacterium CG1_02_49_89]
MKYEFDFERLEVYQLALEFVDEIFTILKKASRDIQFSVSDQLRRASLSITNNIAEGSGKATPKEKIQFYGFAINSARECIPMLTLCLKQHEIDVEKHDSLREKCVRICSMLGKLISVFRGRNNEI